MKKILFLILLIFTGYLGFSQDYLKVKRLEVLDNASFPEDTLKAPKKLGEVRFRSQDQTYYQAISLTAAKKWDYLGGILNITNGTDGAGYRTLLKFPNDSSILARSIGAFGLGGLVVTTDSNSSQITINISLPSQTGQSGKVLGTDGTNASWVTAGSGSGVTTVQTPSSSGNSNGMSISGTDIMLHKVTTTTPGVLTNAVDSINGDKFWFGNHSIVNGSYNFLLSSTENIYRGFRFYTPAGVNFGGVLYNPVQAVIAYGDFTGGLGMQGHFYNNASLRIVFPTNPGMQFPEFGAGNRTGTPTYDLAVTSDGTVVERIARPFYIGSAIATIDFGPASFGAPVTNTVTVTGAQLNDEVRLGIPNASMTATSMYTAWVSAANTVSIRLTTQAAENPNSGQFKVSVYRH